MEIDNQALIDNFRCPICWEIVEEPWETSCCGNLFCEKCMLSYISNKCPICRTKNFKYRKRNATITRRCLFRNVNFTSFA